MSSLKYILLQNIVIWIIYVIKTKREVEMHFFSLLKLKRTQSNMLL